jgi:hypothetical protein
MDSVYIWGDIFGSEWRAQKGYRVRRDLLEPYKSPPQGGLRSAPVESLEKIEMFISILSKSIN